MFIKMLKYESITFIKLTFVCFRLLTIINRKWMIALGSCGYFIFINFITNITMQPSSYFYTFYGVLLLLLSFAEFSVQEGENFVLELL